VKLTGITWQAHRKLVANVTQYFPSSFHYPPCNPAEKISSGYKATKYFHYLFGLGPGFICAILPTAYWKNFCKLMHGIWVLGKDMSLVQSYERHILTLSSLWRSMRICITSGELIICISATLVFTLSSMPVPKSCG